MSQPQRGRARGRGRDQEPPPPGLGQQGIAQPPQTQQRPHAPHKSRGHNVPPGHGQQTIQRPAQGRGRAGSRGRLPAGASQPGQLRQPSSERPSGPSAALQYPMASSASSSTGLQQSRPPHPGQVRPPRHVGPVSFSSAAQASASPSQPEVQRVDSSQGRAFYRGAERASAAAGRPSQGPHIVETPNILPNIAALSIKDSNGSNGNGNGNGGDETPVGRGMSRGKGRQLDGKIPVQRPHTKSKQGSHSRCNIKLLVNYFELEKKEDWRLYQYNLQFTPPQDDRRVIYEIMKPLFPNFGERYVFALMNIFTTICLPNKETVFTSRADVVYTVKATLVKELDPLDMQHFAILNKIMRSCLYELRLKLIGRHYYNVEDRIQLGRDADNLVVYPGYHTSIRQHEDKILLCADIVHKFQQNTSLLDILSRARNQEERDSLKGVIVMCKYNNLTYRCDDILYDMTPNNTFEYRGEKITYAQYFKQKHNVTISNMSQPMVFSRPTSKQQRSGINEIYLVPELLNVTGIPEEMRSDFRKMKQLADYTKMGVDARVQALQRFNRNLQGNAKINEDLRSWGLNLSRNLLQIDARVLPFENIFLDGATTNHRQDTAEWSEACRGKKMASVVTLKNWVVVSHSRFSNEANNFVETMKKAARSIGMMIQSPEMTVVRNFAELQSVVKDYADTQIIMVVMDRTMAQKYGFIKKYLACQLGVLSQCICGHTMSKKGVMSIATKVAVQINAKLGGEPWRINQPAKGIMVVGYDAYHDTVTRGKSFGAVVSNINVDCTRYYGQVDAHTSKEEVSDKFGTYIKNSVDVFHSANGKNPRAIVVFRDGVGEGQEIFVKQVEVPAIKRSLSKISPDSAIPLVFIIVTKRLNTRMFSVSGNNLGNPPPGTILDHTLTLREKFDFFLVSQRVTQGTVSPTGYNVIEDTAGFTVDQIQRLAYKFTHLYYNWQGTVRVPAPCLYAHKLAYITGTGTHEAPKAKLCDKLWFI